jgi:THO complex subunit 4
MSSNLDRSLDEILASRPRSNRRGGRGGAPSAPAGGIRKRSQRVAAQKASISVAPNAAKAAVRIPTGPSAKVTATKIIVSNLVGLA